VNLKATGSRWRGDLAASGDRHPRIRAGFQLFVRYRLWIIGAVALTVAILDGRGAFDVHDPVLFVNAGKKLFTGDALNAFADRTVQEGPLALLIWGLIGYLSDLLNVGARMVASVLLQVGFTFAVVWLIRSSFAERDRPSADLELFAGLLVVLGGLSWTVLSTGHLAEGFIPLLWFQAAREARHGRLERAGLLIALSGGLKLWGVLGVPILLLGPVLDWRKLMRGVAIAAGVIAFLYAPFALFGDFNTFDYRWDIASTSVVHKLFSDSATFSWAMRVTQSVVVVVVGGALALFIRGRQRADWTVPIGIVAVKLLLDPIVFSYYSLTLAVLALLGAALVVRKLPPWVRVLGAAGAYLLLYPSWLLDGNVVGVVALVAVIAVAISALRTPSATDPPVESERGGAFTS
jgi:hypothetical protein